MTLFHGKNKMCQKNTNLPCACQIDPDKFFFLCTANLKYIDLLNRTVNLFI